MLGFYEQSIIRMVICKRLNRREEAHTLGKAFWRVWSVLNEDTFGELEMVPKLKSGKIVGSHPVTT